MEEAKVFGLLGRVQQRIDNLFVQGLNLIVFNLGEFWSK
jgi:hypothetical protein